MPNQMFFMYTMDRGELGKTTASVSNYRFNIDYYIGLLYNSVEISVWEISESVNSKR